MKIIKVNQTSTFQNTHQVEAKKIYETQDAQVIHMALTPGQSLKKHTTPVDVFFYILEGKGTVEIGDETQEVEKDTLIDSPKGIPHCYEILARACSGSLLSNCKKRLNNKKESDQPLTHLLGLVLTFLCSVLVFFN